MRKGFLVMLVIAILFGGTYWYYIAEAICDVPISYKVGNIDERFQVSYEEVRNALSAAESIWEDATGRNLFMFDEDGDYTINFIFDERQKRANEEEAFRETLENKEDLSEDLRTQYEALLREYEKLKVSYESRVVAYEKKLDAYNDEVAAWNEKGGAPADVYERLETTAAELKKEQEKLKDLTTKLNGMVREMNTISVRGNSIITDYNEVVEEYNDRFSEGHEFTQGDYLTKTINVYQFDSKDELLIVLAHEFGHALSLQHVENEESIMYHLMGAQSKDVGATAEDMAEFGRICGSERSFFEIVRIALGLARSS